MLIAIDNENIEMIELLVSARVELGDSLLHAIDEQNVDAVELLLQAHQQQAGKKDLQVSDVITYHQGAHCWSERPADAFEVFIVIDTYAVMQVN